MLPFIPPKDALGEAVGFRIETPLGLPHGPR